MNINVDQIRIDGGTQPRNQIDESIVSEYAEAMRGGAEFPPVVVFNDGVDCWLADGFHRVHAARRISTENISADVCQGTKRDAVLYSVGANSDHGLRRTNCDKRKAVMTLLNDEEWAGWSNAEIARHCAVDEKTVAKYRPVPSPEIPEISHERTVRRGESTYTMNTSKIGKREQEEPAPDHQEQPEVPEAPERPKSRGVGLRYAHEAIAVLKRIPPGDGLRQDAFNTVVDWIETNRGNTQ